MVPHSSSPISRMLLHHLVFDRGQLALLEQHGSGIAILPMSWRNAPRYSVSRSPWSRSMPTAERGGVGRQPLAVSFGVRIARFDDAAERQEQRFGRFELVGDPSSAGSTIGPAVQLLGSNGLFRKSSAPASRPASRVRAPALALISTTGVRQVSAVALDRRTDVDARHPRHHHVEQHEIRTLPAHGIQRRAAVRRRQYR